MHLLSKRSTARRALRAFGTLLLLAELTPKAAYCEESKPLDAPVPVAHHTTGSDAHRLLAMGPAAATAAYTFRAGTKTLPPGTGTYDVKPNCQEARVRREPVIFDSPELGWFDLLYYNYRDNAQATQAERWSFPTVPYLEGDLFNPAREHGVLYQEFGRFFQVRCLPTRVHYVEINGRRYEEYREGNEAWETSSRGSQ